MSNPKHPNPSLLINTTLFVMLVIFLSLTVLFLSTSAMFNPAVRSLVEQQNTTEERLARFFQTANSIQRAQDDCLEQSASNLQLTLPVDTKSIDLEQYHTLNEQTLLCLDAHIVQLQEQDSELFLHPLGASVLLTQMRRTALSGQALANTQRLAKTHQLYAKWSPLIDAQRMVNERLWSTFFDTKIQLKSAQTFQFLKNNSLDNAHTEKHEKEETLRIMAQMHQTLAQDIVQPQGAIRNLETQSPEK